MEDNKFDLEGELQAGRPRPRADFAEGLARDVRGRRRQSRIGLMLATAGLVIVAVASFGGVGYASSSKPAIVKHANSAASAQYTTYKPKTTIKAETKGAAHAQGTAQKVAPKPAPTQSQLPFTGLALWVPLAAGLVLIALGLVLRTRGRRRGTPAH
jgi:hypothetical protein